MPTKLLLFLFVGAFIFYLIKGVPKGLRKGATPADRRSVQARYWIFLVVFIVFFVVLLKVFL